MAAAQTGEQGGQRVVAVTSHGKGELATLAASEGYQTFPIPYNVGGRFSVLSAVGLVPAALIGLDIRKLLKGAAAHDRPVAGSEDLDDNLPCARPCCIT